MLSRPVVPALLVPLLLIGGCATAPAAPALPPADAVVDYQLGGA